jgi:F5/8 type C domain
VAVEIVIAAGPGGGGWVELANATLEDQTLRAPAAVRASSCVPGHPADAAFDDGPSGWRAADEDADPWWSVDFGKPLRFGGLILHWPDGLPPRSYRVEVSDDGNKWVTVYQASRAAGAMSHLSAPGAEASHLRIRFGSADCAALRSVLLRPDAFSSTPNEFMHSVAADYPRGWHPRYWHREQSYWTPVGSPEGRRRGLVNEEGVVEVDEGGFSLEPFVLTGKGLVTWSDVRSEVSMEKGGMPVPRVRWKTRGLSLDILPWMDGEGDSLVLRTTYRLKVTGASRGTRLVVALRPYQVNPPWQAFRNLGGRSPIHRVSHDGLSMIVNDRVVCPSPRPGSMGAAMFEEGGVLEFLAKGGMPPAREIEDGSGLGSGAMLWELPEGAKSLEVTVSVPYFGVESEAAAKGRSKALTRWRRTLGRVKWNVPACAAPAFDCLRTAAGHILINRDGPAIQPGPRRYTRSWVRDCVIMGAALAKVGQPKALKEFITWYAGFQRDDGFVPCVVDRDGVDWLVEHDSHGQFLWGVGEVSRGGDKRFLRKLMPHVRKAAEYLITLRAQRMTAGYRTDERRVFFGLLPESASHEGYLAHPVHSYWDDFWGVRGLETAAELALVAGCRDDAERWRAEAAAFQGDVIESIGRVIREKDLSYVPGSVEWADFDPTATSNGIAMLDFADVLPAGPLHAMLNTYLDGFHRKHSGQMPWNNYTAYEIRIIGAFVRLGKRETANELLEFFLSDRRPRGWNQWPEITWRDPRSPGHLGDVPHTWIAAEYILALSSMVVAERMATATMVLASGMPWEWISGDAGFSVRGLPSMSGPLDFHIHARSRDVIHVEIPAIAPPPGGLFITPPLPEGKRILSVEGPHAGRARIIPGGESVEVMTLPFAADLRLGPAL